MEIPEIHVMKRINWQFFGTLTFKKERMPTANRFELWYALARTLAEWHDVDFSYLLWVLRIEQGEVTGRTHFHCLIGGLPERAVRDAKRIQRADGTWDVNNPTCHALEATWGRLGLHKRDPQIRISRFSLYDARLNGAGYLCKCLGAEDSRLTKDIYETGKFSWGADELRLSDSVYKVARAYLRRSLRVDAKDKAKLSRGAC